MMQHKPKELDIVALLSDHPEHGLVRGRVGTIVHIFGDHEAYEVEFADGDGQTTAMLALTPQQIMPLLLNPTGQEAAA